MTEKRVYCLGIPLATQDIVLRDMGYDPHKVRRISEFKHLQGIRGGVLLAGPLADHALVEFARTRGMEVKWSR